MNLHLPVSGPTLALAHTAGPPPRGTRVNRRPRFRVRRERWDEYIIQERTLWFFWVRVEALWGVDDKTSAEELEERARAAIARILEERRRAKLVIYLGDGQ